MAKFTINPQPGNIEDLLTEIKDLMALHNAQPPVTFPATMAVTGTVTATAAQVSTLSIKIYAVTAASQSFPPADYSALVGLKGAEIQFIGASNSDLLYSRTDGTAPTTADGRTSHLASFTLDSSADVAAFRYLGTAGGTIIVTYKG